MRTNVEYIVRAPKQITLMQREAIYRIIMTYAFPMNTNPLNQLRIAQLPENERQLLSVSEIEFLKRKINKEVLQGVTLSTIPKSLYQLYSVVHVYSNGVELPEFETSIYTNDKALYQSILNAIHDPHYRSIWWKMNDALVLVWKDKMADIDFFIEKQMNALSELIENNFDEIPIPYVQAATNGRALGVYLKSNAGLSKAIGFLKRAALEEYTEREHYLLYCASPTGIKSHQNLNIKSNISWSFSDGIMGGFLFDIETGCCFQYLLKGFLTRTLWSFAIDQKNYQNNQSIERQAFNIPPIPSMLRLLGIGEFHHPRSTICASHGQNIKFGSLEYTSGKVKNKIGKQAVFIANNLHPSIYESEFKRLCEENYRLTPMVDHVEAEATAFGFQFSNYKRILNTMRKQGAIVTQCHEEQIKPQTDCFPPEEKESSHSRSAQH